ncbi:MAG: hypothetical protein ACI9X4_002407 [Glaciecola sp.]|jgi:hypothetical protein
MKFPLLWGLSGAWALIFFWMGVDLFQNPGSAEGSLLSPFTAGAKLQALLAGIGSWTVGIVPLLLTYGLYRFNKSREFGRLTKERGRIDRRLEKLETKK